MNLYLAGPVSGIPGYNHHEFNRVAALLRAAGYEVINPAENPEAPTGLTNIEVWIWHMKLDIAKLVTCVGVALLPRWKDSRGAVLEAHIAGELGMEIKPWPAWVEK